MAHGTGGQESREPALDAAQRRDQPRDGIGGDALRCQLAWRGPHRAIENRAGDETPIEQRRETRPQLQVAQLGKHQRDRRILARHRPANPQRAIERLVGEAKRFGFVGHPEARIEPGLEGELAQQRQAERVDRADRDVGQVLPQQRPPARLDAALLGRAPERRQDALAHLGRRLARERDGQDVPRLDAGAHQVDVAVHQHARLARARRGLEDDVQARVDGIGAIGGVGQSWPTPVPKCRVPERRRREPGRPSSNGRRGFVGIHVVLAAHGRKRTALAQGRGRGGAEETPRVQSRR